MIDGRQGRCNGGVAAAYFFMIVASPSSETWAATMRADQGARLDEAVLRVCKRSGLRRAMVGVESGAQSMMGMKPTFNLGRSMLAMRYATPKTKGALSAGGEAGRSGRHCPNLEAPAIGRRLQCSTLRANRWR